MGAWTPCSFHGGWCWQCSCYVWLMGAYHALLLLLPLRGGGGRDIAAADAVAMLSGYVRAAPLTCCRADSPAGLVAKV